MIALRKNILKGFFRNFSTAEVKTDVKSLEVGKLLEGDLQMNTKNKNEKKINPARSLRSDEKPVPMSPILGPINVENPTISSKKYRWCSCGMSLSQPFCDDSHKGTLFKPIKFTVEEYCDKLELCGCKLSKNAPFCDKATCVALRKE